MTDLDLTGAEIKRSSITKELNAKRLGENQQL